MLEYKKPNHLELNGYLNKFTAHKGSPSYSLGREERFKVSRSASCPGPGSYKSERYMPLHADHDISMHHRSGTRQSPRYAPATEDRMAIDGSLRGVSPYADFKKPNPLGPGQYTVPKLGLRSQEKKFPSYHFPCNRANSQEAVREAKQRSQGPGPDTYDFKSCFDELGGQKLKAAERAYKRGTTCWAADQYSHIFRVMAPGGSKKKLAKC